MNGPKPKTNFDRLLEQAERYPSLERLLLYRNMYFGSGAACLVIVVQLTSAASLTTWLRLSLLASAIAMPLWLCLGGLLEYYIVLGKKSYPHMRTSFTQGLHVMLLLVAGTGLVSSIGLLIYNSYPWAAYLFAGAVVVSIAASIAFNAHLAAWYYSTKSEENSDAGT